MHSIIEIEIKEGITNIGNNVFLCLEKVSIASSVTRIGERAFQQCTSFKTIQLPDGLTYIGYNAFSLCNRLNNVKIQDSVTQIEGFAFSVMACFFASHNLKFVKIPDRETKIGKCSRRIYRY